MQVEEAERRVQALNDEISALTAARADLEAQLTEVSAKRDAAFVVAERTPTPNHTRQADQLEAQARLLEGQVTRKRMALESAHTDLANAQTALQRAHQAAAVEALEALYSEMVELGAKLEQNILHGATWERVATLSAHGNALYRTVAPADMPWRREIFTDVTFVSNRVIQRVEATIGGAVDIHKRRQHRIDVATVADAMELPRLQKEIASLRRLHIDDTDSDDKNQATAPTEAVAVPA